MNPLSGLQGMLAGCALSALVAGTGGFTLAWKLQNANVAAIKLADSQAEAAALKAVREQDAAQRKLSDDAGMASAGQQTAIQARGDAIRRKVPLYVSSQADAHCAVPVGALRLLDDSLSGVPGQAGTVVLPGQPDDSPSGAALSGLADLAAEDRVTYRVVAQRLTDLQALIRAKQAASAAQPSK